MLCNMHPTKVAIMSQNLVTWKMMPLSPILPIPSSLKYITTYYVSLCCAFKALDLRYQRGINLCYAARRQVRYQDEDEDDEYGHNEEITKLEFYTESARGEALLVHALVDHEEVDVLIFKGFSSCLSYSTSPDPTRSILPARAVIKSIDRIKGPFNPANIEYLHKGVAWEDFRTNFLSN
ncbi:PREDICTED: uncharacterized protein LOC109360830 [Lupinus angustifolius]|uniref:uncharacterized protein LOC109360830 n=1 Tax=Lupinus angustifolius TaxID=3871 RepID=UPI00092EF587|nr:PREDICTED: uncharacterized protein LOC109360830 [Lupinus angustifolius]